ncbi:TetR/AcrR family transcriptional regulator [Massilia agilis]|uniref:TetR/AcrR family transcriptional regulator n=1 Tax=Massilia agilis TaxID=1811226 RepID=A0ABT2DA40_9BURK|nr:TetR/AcrR family transcriptional regulator [Massilia agilis]MCS0808022.1 TetR/AcrR family transcriptional regulator [Massilia agilis]
MEPSTKQKRTGGRSARVRETVIAAALEELANKGYDGFSIANVAKAAAVHETSIYRRWGTRDALIIDVLDAAHMAPIPDLGSLHADLCKLMTNSRDLMNSPIGRSLLQLAASVQPEGAFYPVMKEFWQRRIPALEAVFVRAIARGEWNPQVSFRMRLDSLLGAVTWRVSVTHDGVTDDYIEDLVSFHCIGGIVGANKQNGSLA